LKTGAPDSVARISRNALVSLVLLLVVILLVIEAALLFNQRRFIYDEVATEIEHQVRLLGEVSVEAILRSDYDSVRHILERWTADHAEILLLRATFPNGFVLTEQRRAADDTNGRDVVHTVSHAGRDLMTLRVRVDLSGIAARVGETLIRYSSLVVAVTTLIGLVLWLVLRRTAILPYEDAIRRHEAIESQLEQRTTELEALNAELNAFCYSVSHDLRAPLRAIDGYGHILKEEYGARIDAPGHAYIDRSRAAARRIGDVIDDLLRLTALARGGVERLPVDLSSVVEGIVAVLAARNPERAVTTRIAAGLTANGDPGLLHIALENLLGNAWKYTSKTPDAVIEFGSEQRNGETVYCVRDNGAGFDATHSGKLFQPFQRLHGAQEFPGSGIGLATVARIIHRHGGRVWAEGAVGKGATFYFTVQPIRSPA
jgi:signal transduction histidine kinase